MSVTNRRDQVQALKYGKVVLFRNRIRCRKFVVPFSLTNPLVGHKFGYKEHQVKLFEL